MTAPGTGTVGLHVESVDGEPVGHPPSLHCEPEHARKAHKIIMIQKVLFVFLIAHLHLLSICFNPRPRVAGASQNRTPPLRHLAKPAQYPTTLHLAVTERCLTRPVHHHTQHHDTSTRQDHALPSRRQTLRYPASPLPYDTASHSTNTRPHVTLPAHNDTLLHFTFTSQYFAPPQLYSTLPHHNCTPLHFTTTLLNETIRYDTMPLLDFGPRKSPKSTIKLDTETSPQVQYLHETSTEGL